MLDLRIVQDGNSYMCVDHDFTDLQNSPSWWGDTPIEALEAYLAAHIKENK